MSAEGSLNMIPPSTPQLKLEIYLEDRQWAGEAAIWICGEDAQGRRYYAEPMRMVFTAKEDGARVDPTLLVSGRIGKDFLPALHEAIARGGYAREKPMSSMETMKKHLEDMRALVFHQAGVTKP